MVSFLVAIAAATAEAGDGNIVVLLVFELELRWWKVIVEGLFEVFIQLLNVPHLASSCHG